MLPCLDQCTNFSFRKEFKVREMKHFFPKITKSMSFKVVMVFSSCICTHNINNRPDRVNTPACVLTTRERVTRWSCGTFGTCKLSHGFIILQRSGILACTTQSSHTWGIDTVHYTSIFRITYKYTQRTILKEKCSEKLCTSIRNNFLQNGYRLCFQNIVTSVLKNISSLLA